MSENKKVVRKPIPKWIINFNNQMEFVFSCWLVENPSVQYQIYRTSVFLISIIITVYWPVPNLLINWILTMISWIYIVNSKKDVPRVISLLTIMMSISNIYYTMQIFLP